MEHIMVTSAVLRSAAEELRGMNARYYTAIEELENQEAALKAQWEGEANESFHAAFLRDEEQMKSFYSLIGQYCAALEGIAEKYVRTEAQNVQIATTRSR